MQAITFRVIKEIGVEHMVNLDKFSAFLGQIYKGYRRDVEYHNDIHGADVLEMTFFFMKQGQLNNLCLKALSWIIFLDYACLVIYWYKTNAITIYFIILIYFSFLASLLK